MTDSLESVYASVCNVIAERGLAGPETPVLLMVSGGSDSTALAYLAHDLHERGALGPLAMLHVNHQLRGKASDGDAEFTRQLALLLDIPFFLCEIDLAQAPDAEHSNMEALARQARYQAADEALRSHCHHTGYALSAGRIATAHTADDRVENFYMRSIVGTGPGGFRSMRYCNGAIAHMLLDLGRCDLRRYIEQRAEQGLPVARDEMGALWREDATNADTDFFRAFVRHEIVSRAKERNPRLIDTLSRTMNLIADEDDLLEEMARMLENDHVTWMSTAQGQAPEYDAGCLIDPAFGEEPLALRRRACFNVLQEILGQDARVETASVEGVLAAWGPDERPRGGYVTNIQGNLAISANKHGVRIEPMAAFRARRKRV